jgi:hypothetical protein
MRIWMRDSITKITVKDCTPKIITDGEKENNAKAPSIEKIQNQKTLHYCPLDYETDGDKKSYQGKQVSTLFKQDNSLADRMTERINWSDQTLRKLTRKKG